MNASYQILSELSEKQMEADVAHYPGWIGRAFDTYRLRDINEQVTGADKKLDWRGVAYFLQFKKSLGLKQAFADFKPAKNEAAEQRIRRFRYLEDLDQSPHSLCFKLRRDGSGNSAASRSGNSAASRKEKRA